MIIFLKNGCSLVHESPHEKMHNYIEFAWACSTIFGILLFMIEVTILCWIQFYCLVKEAAYIATAILVPCVFLFVWFAVTFYRNLTTHTYETRKTGIKLPKKYVHFFTDNIARKVSSGQICPRFLRTCLSSNIVDILSTKSRPFPFFFHRTLVTPPPLDILLLKKRNRFAFHWDRTQYYYVPSNSDLQS